MKRLNPETGKPFKCGDVREDGKVFHSYFAKNKISVDGYYYEHWEDEKIFYYNKTKRRLTSKNHALTHNGRALLMLRNCKKSAKRRNIVFNLNVEDLLPTVELKHCQLTGLPFDLNPPKQKTMNLYAPSVDRIDNNKGYTKDNIRVVLWAVNRAVGEDGDEAMLPILKKMVKAIEKNVNKKSTTPLPAGAGQQGQDKSPLGTIPAAGTREDHYDLDHYQRTVRGEDADYRAQTRGGDGVGYGSKEVGTLEVFTRIEDHGQPDAEIIRLDFGSGHLPDKP
jgi:hypothetical protein